MSEEVLPPRGYERVLVTGTSGFIGGHLAVALTREGYRVLGLDLSDPARPVPSVRYVRCDIRDRDSLVTHVREFAPDAVLHLAGRTDLRERRDLAGYAANIAGVEHLLAAIRASQSVRRAICTSSQLVCRVGYLPLHDQDYQPTTLYGQSKVLTERIWREADGAGTEWSLVRPTTIWGPWMSPHYLQFFRMIRDGRYWHIGRQLRFKSFGFVGNTVAQYIRLLQAPVEAIRGRVFYLADYEPTALEAWADAFQRALGARPIRSMPLGVARVAARLGDFINFLGLHRFPFNSFRLNNVLTEYRMDLSSTREVCGELPYTMADGISLTTKWLREVWATDGHLDRIGDSRDQGAPNGTRNDSVVQ